MLGATHAFAALTNGLMCLCIGYMYIYFFSSIPYVVLISYMIAIEIRSINIYDFFANDNPSTTQNSI